MKFFFFSYSWTKGNESGFGNTYKKLARVTMGDVSKIEALLEEVKGFDECAVISWQEVDLQ